MTDTIEQKDGRASSEGGLRLYWKAWLPSDPKAILLFVGGLCEHTGRYHHLAERFAARGFGCYVLDLRGHGQSDGPRGDVGHFGEYLADVRAVHDVILDVHRQLPIFLVGHSMGGLITIRYVLGRPRDLAGAILSSPYLFEGSATRKPQILYSLLKVIAALLPGLRIPTGIKGEHVTRDVAVAEAYDNDPLIFPKITARWAASIKEGQKRAMAEPDRLELPTLLMISGADVVVDPEATRRWAERAPKDKVEHVVWEGFFHEMFNDLGKEKVFDRMETWLEAQLEA